MRGKRRGGDGLQRNKRGAPDDPIAAAAGALAEELGQVQEDRLRREARKSERAAEDRRARKR